MLFIEPVETAAPAAVPAWNMLPDLNIIVSQYFSNKFILPWLVCAVLANPNDIWLPSAAQNIVFEKMSTDRGRWDESKNTAVMRPVLKFLRLLSSLLSNQPVIQLEMGKVQLLRFLGLNMDPDPGWRQV